ncbi:hypothetical protein [Caulobacter sp. 17J80-11]|uniref:hypothetical protein n=1 Tax=Caulobacter sp. 17J80-11 TaxID=2763502 RepID=UPI0016536DD2|nr:hypothetical protein [Caulobacter sp. 17J80-11]MBC6983673.1 hypothetical protein [Caulobacter sp. 17J80-11]
MRKLLTGAVFAVATLVPAATVFASDPLFERQNWTQASERRFDRALGDNYLPASSRPATKIGEVSMAMNDRGDLSNPQMTRSTGEANADAMLMTAANRLDNLPKPPSSVAARTVLLRVAFITPSGVAPWTQFRQGRQPYVYVEQAERNSDSVVVIGAVR